MKWLAKALSPSRQTLSRGRKVPSGRRTPVVLRVEILEDRAVPAVLGLSGTTLTYKADAGETNNVTIGPSSFGAIVTDAPNVLITPGLGGAVATDWLKGLNYGFDIAYGTPVSVSFSVGFPLFPIQIPGGAMLLPEFNPNGVAGGNLFNVLANSIPEFGGAVIGDAAVPQNGNVFYQVQQADGSATISDYELYQAVVDPTQVVQSPNTNTTFSNAQDIGAFTNVSSKSHVSKIVEGTFQGNSGSQFFKFNVTHANERVVVIMDNEPPGTGGLVASTQLSLLNSLGQPVNNDPAAVNLSTSAGNAVGAINVSLPGTYYVQVTNFGLAAGKNFHFVVLQYDDNSTETDESAAPDNSDTTATANSLPAGNFGAGQISPSSEIDTYSASGATNSKVVFAYVDTHNADPNQSQAASIKLIADDGTTSFGSATGGGPPGLNASQVTNLKHILAQAGLNPGAPTITNGSISVDLSASSGTGTVNLSALSNDQTIQSGPGGALVMPGTGNNVLKGDAAAGASFLIVNNSSSGTGSSAGTNVIFGGGGENVLLVQGDPSSNNISLTFLPAVTTASTVNGVSLPNGYEEVDVNDSGAIAKYYINLNPQHVPDLQEIKVLGGAGDDTLQVFGHVDLGEGVFFDGGPGNNTLVVHDGDGVIPGDTKGHLDILRQSHDHGTGSITVGQDQPVGFNNVQSATVTPLDPLTGGTGNDKGGRLVVFSADPFEPNNSVQNATDLGLLNAAPVLPNIDNFTSPFVFGASTLPPDEDWYRYQAPLTSTYTFTVGFNEIATVPNGNPGLPGSGDLVAEVYDANGNKFSAAPSATGFTRVVPGVGFQVTVTLIQGQTYYLRVHGATPQAINVYNITVTHEFLGPQVTGVNDFSNGKEILPTTYNLFGQKPTNGPHGPTPLVNGLVLHFQDLPPRAPGQIVNGKEFFYGALDDTIAANPGQYVLVGDNSGVIPIKNVIIVTDPPAGSPNAEGQPAAATVELDFAQPLPDDRFTLTIKDTLTDPSGNPLAGGSNASQPNGGPTFPSGQDNVAGDFVARFTVNSRPDIGVASLGTVYLDLNHNFVFDPVNKTDQTNADKAFAFGLQSDAVFAGRFTAVGGTPDGFSRIGAYGQVGGVYRWLLDFSNDGTPDYSAASGIQVNGLPVAGHFDQALPKNTDQVGIFDGNGTWYLDTNGNNNLDSGDLVVRDGLRGIPIVGDFDGNGFTDLATYRPDTGTFYFDFYDPTPGLKMPYGRHTATLQFSFPGKNAKPVAADMNMDGVTDVGLYVTDTNGTNPGSAQWYFLVSQGKPTQFAVNTLNHAFSPVPFGSDLFAQFGVSSGLPTPLVGLFDPPIGDAPVLSTPNTLSPVAGTPQNAQAGAAYGTPFKVKVTNSAGFPISGATVTFQAPPNGPSGTFAGGLTAAVVTDLNGLAAAPAFTANSVVGSFTLTATVAGVNTPVLFNLRNTGKPAAVQAVSDTGQAAEVGKVYGTALQVKVTDAQGNPVSGASVTFSAPTNNGPGGTFAGKAAVKVLTGQDGIATAPTFTANTRAGSFTVSASVPGVGSVSFSLTNQAGPASQITAVGGTPQNARVNNAYQTALQVKVTDAFGNVIQGASVIFKVVADTTTGAGGTFAGGTSVTVKTDQYGIATAPTLTANGKAGSFTVEASINGITGPAVFHLQNKTPLFGHVLTSAFWGGV